MLRQISSRIALRRSSQIIFMIMFVLLQFLVVGVAFLGGYFVSQWTSGDPLQIGMGSGFPLFNEAYDLLKDNAYFDLPESKKLEYGMIRGLLTAVNEPYTVFVEPPQHELQSDQLSGKFGGIGVRVERDAENFVYIYPLPSSPALAAGVQDGDRLLAVEALSITPETPNEEIHAAIRGKVGEKVRITVGRAPAYSPIELTVERAEVPLPSVTAILAPDQPSVGVIYVNVIAETTPDEILKAVEDLKSRGASRFIIDVRNNGGGLVEAGVDTARLFLKNGVVIEEQYRDQPVKPFKVEKDGPLADLPVVILVNRGTASAAEIFAGAIKGQGRAPIIGTRTFGKDTIQLVFSLSDGSSLHVTAAHWWVPGLEPKIGGNGIQPDVPMEEGADENLYLQKAIETVLR